VDIVEVIDDEFGDRVLEDQVHRFAITMAVNDKEMADQIMQEMGKCTVWLVWSILSI